MALNITENHGLGHPMYTNNCSWFPPGLTAVYFPIPIYPYIFRVIKNCMNYFISPVKYSSMFPGAYKKKNLKLIYMTLNGFLNFFPHPFNTMWPLVKVHSLGLSTVLLLFLKLYYSKYKRHLYPLTLGK